MRYDIYLDGRLCTTSPDDMAEAKVRALVDEVIVELRLSGVVEIMPHKDVPVAVRRYRRTLHTLAPRRLS